MVKASATVKPRPVRIVLMSYGFMGNSPKDLGSVFPGSAQKTGRKSYLSENLDGRVAIAGVCLECA
jgi:hypothetical protein